MSEPIVHRVVSGTWKQNGYVVEDGDGGGLLLVDPGTDLDAFEEVIARLAAPPLAIVNTHAHFDHIGSVAPLMEAHDLPFYLHGGDAVLLRQANLYRALFGESKPLQVPPGFTDLAAAGDLLELGPFALGVLETPGHTRGSVCLRLGDVLFTGDTLFGKGAGRVDLPGGSASDMAASQKVLEALPDDLLVYPGHGKELTMSEIRRRMATS